QGLKVCGAINAIKQAAVGGNKTTTAYAHALTSKVYERTAFEFVARHFGEIDADPDLIVELSEAVEAFKNDAGYSWFGIRASNLITGIGGAYDLIKILVERAPV